MMRVSFPSGTVPGYMSPICVGQGRLMAMCDKTEPRRPGVTGQVTQVRRHWAKAGLLLAALALPACSEVERMSDSRLTAQTPVNWWHDLQGGKIAEQRPPPPGVTDPYPNLGQVPPRPTLTDAATRRALAARLVAERDRTERAATQDPLVLPAPAGAAPAPANAAPRPPVPPPDPGASVAVMDAATAPAPPAAPPPAAPPAVVPSGPPAIALPPGVTPGPPTAPRPAVESGPVPDLPAAAPPLPRLGGMPATVDAPAVPRVPPPVAVAFRPGSAALPASADAALRGLAGRRAGAAIAVSAGGDAAGPGAEAQARALPLALRRTRAIQDVLIAAGVPAGSLHAEAAALGRGGAARLLQ